MFDVRQYILFGSKARGDAAKDSDVDLLIITGRALSWQEEDMITHEIFETNLSQETNFSHISVYVETWENGLISVLPFHDNVEKEGITV